MLKKGTKLYSILTGTCPRCQNNHMYVDRNPYNISQTLRMHERCDYCGTKYKMEPNFFFGAMYVSYGVAIAIGIAIFLISALVFEATISHSFLIIMVGLIVLMPVITRISRNIYINIFMNYDKNLDTKQRND